MGSLRREGNSLNIFVISAAFDSLFDNVSIDFPK